MIDNDVLSPFPGKKNAACITIKKRRYDSTAPSPLCLKRKHNERIYIFILNKHILVYNNVFFLCYRYHILEAKHLRIAYPNHHPSLQNNFVRDRLRQINQSLRKNNNFGVSSYSKNRYWPYFH
ncbi:hypothetical protein ACJX0J_015579, partial [Zea mays]